MLNELCPHPLFIHYLFLFEWILIGKKLYLLEKLQNDAFLLENIYVIRRRTILKLHQFNVVISIFFKCRIREFFLSAKMKNFN